MSNISVEYLSHDGSDNTIANTARVSMELSGGWENLPEGYSEEQRNRLISYLAKHKHTTPFRHNSISIRCKVPVFIARQLGKHQAGLSWNEVSRRYVDTGVEFFKPDSWRKRPEKNIKQGSSDEVVTHVVYDGENVPIEVDYENLLSLSHDTYTTMLKAGVAPEVARMVLPQSMMVEYVWTGNLMAFAHVYNLRAEGHAQLEAQEFAHKLDEIIKPLFPVSWTALTS